MVADQGEKYLDLQQAHPLLSAKASLWETQLSSLVGISE